MTDSGLLSPPADWVPPRKTYFIAATPRSGSNLFCSAIDSLKVLGSPTEYFNPVAIRHLVQGPVHSTTDLCYLAHRSSESAGGVCGIKLFAEHFDAISGDIRLSEWFPNAEWVFLRRRDILGQAISHLIAQQTESWHSLEVPQGSPSYDAERLHVLIWLFISSNARWELFFARNGISPILAWYEDFPRTLTQTIRETAARLDVSLPADLDLASSFSRQRTDRNAEFREKYLAQFGDPSRFPTPVPQPLGRPE